MSKFGLNPIFSDHMVLQRQKPITVWGTCEGQPQIEVDLNGNRASAKIRERAWKAVLQPMEAETNLTLTVRAEGKEIVISDVAVGEVWIGGGQSNMEFFMKYEANYDKEVGGCANANIRFACDADSLKLEGDGISALAVGGLQGEEFKKVELKETACEAEGLVLRLKGLAGKAQEKMEIRFAMTDYYEVNLYSSEGIPAMPFTCEVQPMAALCHLWLENRIYGLTIKHNDPEAPLGWGERLGFGNAFTFTNIVVGYERYQAGWVDAAH